MGIEKLHKALREADAVVVGAGAGLSTAAGFTYSGERFLQHFADFISKYGFTDMYSAGFYPFPTEEEKWAYWSRHIYYNRYVPAPKPVYENLLKLLQDKDYFVITTNVDHQFQKAGFDKQRLFYTQGDYGLFQCAKPCHQLMQQQGHLEPTGTAKITKAYNLPCKHVIHTVGPIIPNGIPTAFQQEQLASCYRSILQLADEKRLESVAFCCISTGEFRFPNQLAAEIAVKTVSDFFVEHPESSIKQVVFNVFKDVDKRIYEGILRRAED